MVENILEAMVDAVLVVDTDGKITRANTAASGLTGFPLELLTKMQVAQILVDDNSGLRTVVRERIAEGNVLRREESWLVRKDGARIPVSVTGSPVLSGDNELQGIVLVARDMRELHQVLAEREAEISRRRAAEDELRKAKASIEEQLDHARSQLEMAERRATLGTLAGGVGHELRNIAMTALSATEFLAEALQEGEAEANAALAELLPDLRTVAEHVATHGQRLLQLARPGPDRVEPLDLNRVVRDCVDMLRTAGKTKLVTVEVDLAAEPLEVTVNRTRIEQILINLINNAVDALDKRDKRIWVTTRTYDDLMVSCEVRDNGSGIPPDVLEKIWTPFFTTKPEDKGTGLGLPVAKEIVESYGGQMTVTTVAGQGTTFKFTLPR